MKPAEIELALSDYPELFEKEVIIVIGNNASGMEIEGTDAIVENLFNLTGNIPVIKTGDEITGDELAGHNLIVVGGADLNEVRKDMCDVSDAVGVTDKYPGAGKGVLEVLRDPWDHEKAMLLVAGSDEGGMVAGINELHRLQVSEKKLEESRGDTITVVGTLREVISQWSLSFDECVFDSPSIEVNGKIYYVENVCLYLYLFSGNLTERRIIVTSESDFIVPGKTIKVTGKIVKREVEVPLRKELNPPTKIETFDVIVVSDLKVLNGSANER